MRVEASGLPVAYVSSFMMTLAGQAPWDGPDMGGLSDLGFPSISQAVELAGPDATPEELLGHVFLLVGSGTDRERPGS